MSRRALATAIAVPLMIGLWVAAAVMPVPYVTYHPGSTTDMLSTVDGRERIQVSGHKAYRDDGGLRMVTVSVDAPDEDVSLFEALEAWFDDEDAVEPYDAVYDEGETREDSNREGAVDMLSSQDTATAVALKELGYKLTPIVRVYQVVPDSPSDGVLKANDRLVSINGTPLPNAGPIFDEVGKGKPVTFVIQRDGKRLTKKITPVKAEGRWQIGLYPGSTFKFPVQVQVLIDPRIGGPSAGLMFSLAIYDTLTPGSLTNGKDIAGTGTIAVEGQVGPIGGIPQKIVAARDAGAELFLVPEANWDDAQAAPRGDMRLACVRTMSEARKSIEKWAEDSSADLPTCDEK